MFISSYGSSVLPHVARTGRTPTEFFPPRYVFSRPGCLGLITKNRVKSVFFEAINSSAASMFSKKDDFTVFSCEH